MDLLSFVETGVYSLWRPKKEITGDADAVDAFHARWLARIRAKRDRLCYEEQARRSC